MYLNQDMAPNAARSELSGLTHTFPGFCSCAWSIWKVLNNISNIIQYPSIMCSLVFLEVCPTL